MEELENMRNAWLSEYGDNQKEDDSVPDSELMEEETDIPVQEVDVPKKSGKLTAEQKRSILSANAAKARAAKAKKQAHILK